MKELIPQMSFKLLFNKSSFIKKKYTFLSERPWTSGSPFLQSWYWLSIVFCIRKTQRCDNFEDSLFSVIDILDVSILQ